MRQQDARALQRAPWPFSASTQPLAVELVRHQIDVDAVARQAVGGARADGAQTRTVQRAHVAMRARAARS